MGAKQHYSQYQHPTGSLSFQSSRQQASSLICHPIHFPAPHGRSTATAIRTRQPIALQISSKHRSIDDQPSNRRIEPRTDQTPAQQSADSRQPSSPVRTSWQGNSHRAHSQSEPSIGFPSLCFTCKLSPSQKPRVVLGVVMMAHCRVLNATAMDDATNNSAVSHSIEFTCATVYTLHIADTLLTCCTAVARGKPESSKTPIPDTANKRFYTTDHPSP